MASRRGWWGYLACGWALLFAALHFYWALGGDGLASAAGTELATTRPQWFVLGGLWGVGLLFVAGAGLAFMLTRRQRPGPLKRLVAAAGWAVSLLLLLRGVGLEVLLLSSFYESNTALTLSQVRWSLVLWNPWFILGGVASAGHSRRSRPAEADAGLAQQSAWYGSADANTDQAVRVAAGG